MAIRFKYDTAAVLPSENEAKQKFGQQLVQQQQKYANDQRQGMQDRMYDQQRLGMQSAAMLEREKLQGQQALERMNQAQKFGAEQNDADRNAKIQQMNQQRDVGVFDAQVKSVTAMAQEALKNPNVPTDVKRRIQQLVVGKGAVNGMGFDAPMRQQYLDRYHGEMTGLLNEIPPQEPLHVQANNNLQYYVPSRKGYVDKATAEQLGPDEVQVFQDGKPMPAPVTQKKMPATYEEYAGADVNRSVKELAAKENELRTRYEDAGTAYDESKLQADAYAELKGKYDFMLGQIGGAKNQPAVPGQAAQSGQPVVPPVQPEGQPQPAQPAQGQKPWVPWSDRAVGEEYVDLDGSILVKTQTGVISKGKVPPGTPLPVEAGVAPPNEFVSQAARDVAAADAAVSDSVPPLAAEQASLDATFPLESPAGAAQGSQNPWAEIAAPVEQSNTSAASLPQAPPDFGKLASGATDESDRAVFGKLQGIYDTQTPEVQSAIGVLVDASRSKRERAQAALYLKNAGIDLEKLAGPKIDDATKRVNQYQNNSTTTMR